MLKLFLNILELSLLLSPLILILLVFSGKLNKRYSPRLKCFLWLALALRLILPLLGERYFVLRPIENIYTEAQAEDLFFLPRDTTILGDAQRNLAENTTASKSAPKTMPEKAAIIWLSGAAAFSAYHSTVYIYSCKKLKKSSRPITGKQELEACDNIKQKYKIRGNVNLCQSEKISSPLLFGFLRPVVMLPGVRNSQSETRAAMNHELMHLKRGDLWLKLLILLSQAVHWFNPLVWLMASRANNDIELACDSMVLKNADTEMRKTYGFAILSVMAKQSLRGTSLTTHFGGSKKLLLERFENIADSSKRKRGIPLLCTVLAVSLSCGALVGCSAVPKVVTHTEPIPQIEIKDRPEKSSNLESDTSDFTEEEPKAPEAPAINDMGTAIPAEEARQAAEALKQADNAYTQISLDETPYAGGDMVWPVPGYHIITSPYGWRYNGKDFHTGIDIGGADIHGANIVAANGGTVRFVNLEDTPGAGYGIYLIIDHGGGISTLYAQCSSILVNEGDTVKRGQVIAAVGETGFSTGPHLHFEVRNKAAHKDPLPYISESEDEPSFIWPAGGDGGFISAGKDAYPGHTGMDIVGPEGTDIYASASGTVSTVKESYVGYGNHIVIEHSNGYQTLYAHCDELLVKKGDTVKKGQIIATMGKSGNSTGVQLHFEIRLNGDVKNPEKYVEAPG